MTEDRTWQDAMGDLRDSKESEMRLIEITNEESLRMGAYLSTRMTRSIIGSPPPINEDITKRKDFSRNPLFPLLVRLTRVYTSSTPESWTVLLGYSELEMMEKDVMGQINGDHPVVLNAKLALRSLKLKWQGVDPMQTSLGGNIA